MKIIPTILFSILTNYMFSQNTIEISNDKSTLYFYRNLGSSLKKQDLESIQNSNEKIIRIWKDQEVYTLKKNLEYQKTFTNKETKKSFTYKKSIVESTNSLNIEHIKNLDPFYSIDCSPITIEAVENNHYYIKTIGCKKEISSILKNVDLNEIDNDIQLFIKNLPSGEYQNSRTTFTINQPILDDSKKNTLYKKIESALKEKNIASNDPTKQPLIKINSETAYFEDLNNIEENKVKSYNLLDKEYRLIYGAKGNFGVILIETE